MKITMEELAAECKRLLMEDESLFEDGDRLVRLVSDHALEPGEEFPDCATDAMIRAGSEAVQTIYMSKTFGAECRSRFQYGADGGLERALFDFSKHGASSNGTYRITEAGGQGVPWRMERDMASFDEVRRIGLTGGEEPKPRPTIVCLCGSTKFYREYQRANYEETMAGRIVLSVGFFMHSAEAAHGEAWGCTPDQKRDLDELHLRKVELADEVLVLNVGGYVGESTDREIAWAVAHGKRVRWLEPDRVPAHFRHLIETQDAARPVHRQRKDHECG